MLNIETKMEVFARTYSKDTGVEIVSGSNFATDGKRIFVVPISDQADPELRKKTEVIVYHETGHIKTGDVKHLPKEAIQKRIYNWIRDVVVEHTMETEYPGMKQKWAEFLTAHIKESKTKPAQNDPIYNKIMRALYLTCRGKQVGVDLETSMTPEVQEFFDKKFARFIDPICNDESVKGSLAITEEIYKSFTQEEKEQPKDESDNSEGSGNSGENGSDQETGAGNSEDEEEGVDENSETGNIDGNETSGSSPDDSGSKGGKASSGQTDDSAAQGDQQGGDDAGNDSELSDEAKEALEQAKKEIENGDEGKTIAEETTDELNEYVQNNKVYRVVPGLKEDIRPIEPRYGWEHQVNMAEQDGRKMVGYLGGKMKRLFVSERAPVWQRNIRSGKLDIKKTWKVALGSQDIMRRKTIGKYEDACVYEVIDHSSSMCNEKARMAQAILTTVSSDLDKLRIPFGAVGFTMNSSRIRSVQVQAEEGIRAQPIILNHIKGFSEAYRRVRSRFIWPSNCDITCELPAIEFAAKQLAMRRETKKILFILTDGGTCTGSGTLDAFIQKATKEYIQRLLNAGVRVVGIGIQDRNISSYCPDFIHVANLNNFAHDFYRKLTQLIL